MGPTQVHVHDLKLSAEAMRKNGSGITGCIPDTAWGSQPADSFHRAWEQEMRVMGSPSNIEVVLHWMEHLYVKWDRQDWMEPPQGITFPFRAPTPSSLSLEWRPLIFFAVDAKSTIDINEVRGFEQMSDLHNASEAHLCSMGMLGDKHLL